MFLSKNKRRDDIFGEEVLSIEFYQFYTNLNCVSPSHQTDTKTRFSNLDVDGTTRENKVIK